MGAGKQTNNSVKMKGRILLACGAICWGLAGVCVKSITWGPFSIIFSRCLISLILILVMKRSLKLHFSKINLLGALMTAVTAFLYICATKMTTAGTAIILQYMSTIYIFLYSVIFKHRKAKWYELLITLAVFGGCVLSFADNIDTQHLWGNVLAAASGMTFAAEIIICNDSRCDAEDTVCISNIASILICIPFMFFDKGLTFTAKNIIWILVLSIFQYGLANILYTRGIQKVESVEASLILMLEPITNPILVAIFLQEKMGPLALIGAVIVIVGIILYTIIPTLVEKKK